QSALDLMRHLVAERAELPVAAVRAESRMLADLHLNSISVGQLVAGATRRLGLPPIIELTDFANATVGRIAQALEELAKNGGSKTQNERHRLPAGIDTWVRPFTINWKPTTLRRPGALADAKSGQWRVIGPDD